MYNYWCKNINKRNFNVYLFNNAILKLNKMAVLDVDIISNQSFLKSVAFKFTKQSEYSDDLVQDTMLKALQNSDKFKEGSNLKAWLYTIMKNIFINGYRKSKKLQKVDTEPADLIGVYKGLTVKNDGENNLYSEYIEVALSELTDEFKVPFLLYFEGHKYNEIADKLSLPLGTVKSRIYHARKYLKDALVKFEITSSIIS